MIIFKQVKELGLSNVIGLCPDDPRFRTLCNTAVERLVPLGDWWGTKRRLKTRVFGNRITLPMSVAALERVSVNGIVETIRGEGFEFLEGGWGVREDQNFYVPQWFCQNNINDLGTSPISNQLIWPIKIAAFSSADECPGAFVTIFGIDKCGDFIMSQDSNGCWSDGVTLKLDGTSTTSPPTTNQDFAQITSIVKSDTAGIVTIATNDQNGTGYILSKLGPHDRTSSYRIYGIPTPRCSIASNGRYCSPVVTALVKMAFVPVYSDNDVLSIWSLPAVKDAILSEYYKTKPDGLQTSMNHFASALAMLNAELMHHRGSGQTNPLAVTDDGTFGASQTTNLWGSELCRY